MCRVIFRRLSITAYGGRDPPQGDPQYVSLHGVKVPQDGRVFGVVVSTLCRAFQVEHGNSSRLQSTAVYHWVRSKVVFGVNFNGARFFTVLRVSGCQYGRRVFFVRVLRQGVHVRVLRVVPGLLFANNILSFLAIACVQDPYLGVLEWPVRYLFVLRYMLLQG